MGKLNYRIRDFERLELTTRLELEFLIKNGLKANPVISFWIGKRKPKYDELFSMSWGELLELRDLLKDENVTGAIQMLYGISKFQIGTVRVINFFAVLKWITSQIELIQNLEKDQLTPVQTKESKPIDLERFDYLPNLRLLANGDMLKYDDYLKIPYSVIFRELALINALNNSNNG